MFRRLEVTVQSNPSCSKAVVELDKDDFLYYDKDGFELNKAEQKFYQAMAFPINYPLLNHTCWQEPWFELEDHVEGLVLDHSMFLCRCNYIGAAEEQLRSLKKDIPQVDLLLRTKAKWGYDFALDAVRDGEIFEVLHVEYDSNDYHQFSEHMMRFGWTVRHTDWYDAANRIWEKRSEWQQLKSFDQNHWKAQYLLGWAKAEYTEKST
jgi:hypothetical protein